MIGNLSIEGVLVLVILIVIVVYVLRRLLP